MARSERQKYKFLFRCAGEDPVIAIRETRAGNAESCARRLAKDIAKKLKWSEAVCVWMGPEDKKIPEPIREELRRERVS